MTFPSLALDDPRVVVALRTWGAPYGWAKGDPSTADDPGSERDDADCGGHAQEVLVRAGLLHPEQPDRSARGLADICELVTDARPFDLYFYGTRDAAGKVRAITHVGVCVGPGAVLTASGGGSATHGDNPRAYVHLQRADYRGDLLFIGRVKMALREAP